MKDRYSILVGIFFVAIVAVALIHGVPGGGGTLGLDKQPPRWALPEFAVPAAAGAARRRRQRRPGRLLGGELPCPAELPSHSRLPGADARRDPRLRSLRPPLGDLFLVQQRGRLRRPAGRRQPGLLALPWTRELPLAGHSRRSRHRPRADPAVAIGRCRSATTATAPSAGLYRVGGCPTFAYVYPGGTLESASIGNLDVSGLSERIERLLRASRTAEGS